MREISRDIDKKLYVNNILGKGVVTGILPDNQMPQREIDGKHLDIILSPNSVIGRLNLGQIFETTINRISEEVYKDLLSKDNEKDFKELYIEFMKDLLPERLHNQLSPIEKMRSGKPLKEFIQSIKDDGYLRIPQVPFETINMDLLSKWYNKYNMNNDTLLLNGKKIINPILTGNQYFLKLKHLPEKKVSACNSKKFGSKSLQPTKDNSYRMYKAPIGASPNTVGEFVIY